MNNNYVVIKSFPRGISLFLDEKASFEDIIAELSEKLNEARSFFKDAKMALSIEGRELTSEEQRTILNAFSENTDMKILCIIGKDDRLNQAFINALDTFDLPVDEDREPIYLYRGTLKNEQSLELDQTVVIIGDVYPGCSVVSTKDIIVIGGLYGEAWAGCQGDLEAFVIALEMSPERLGIEGYIYKNHSKAKWGIKSKQAPKIARIRGGEIVLDPIEKDLF